MILHSVHDCSNKHVMNMLMAHLSLVTDPEIIHNYHPDYAHVPGNLFYILDSGRYAPDKGSYFVVEENNEYICSAGWNEYGLDSDIALLLTRMYVNIKYRSKYYAGRFILPKAIVESKHYSRRWITCNDHNIMIYKWFARSAESRSTALFGGWPAIYTRFTPVGKKMVYYTLQHVAELTETVIMNDNEKLRFLEDSILSQFGKTVTLTPTATLLGIGLDSLDIVELQMHYEDVTGKETLDIGAISTVQDLINAMQ